MKPSIIDRGRGPEIAGSRITVFDVLASTRAGRPVEELAREWRLSVEQVECALKYIGQHREEIEREWAEIQEQNEKDREESEARVTAILASRPPTNPDIWEKFQRARRERRHARDPGRHESPGTNGSYPGVVGEPEVE